MAEQLVTDAPDRRRQRRRAGPIRRARLPRIRTDVVKGRALPDVCDGNKPVQRRILYSMQRMGLGFAGAQGAKPVKSARVVGDVLGRFHPHSDQAAYDALVRMAQDFSQRYPLIDGQGNFGSRDGDGAAAMRYTEARLAPIARLLLDEIDEGTVDFVPNYDGSTEEPSRLPARLPFVLLNGASGIAVGLATEVPSHNLREVAAAAVALIRNDKLADDALFELLPGARLSRRRADHQQRRRDPRRLCRRPRLAEGARALEDRGPGARPVADGGHRAAAVHQRAEGARGDRGAHQPQGQGRARRRCRRSRCSSSRRCWRCSTPCATNRARTLRCGWCSSRKTRTHRAGRAGRHAAGAHQPRDQRADQPDDGRAATAGRRRRACARCWPSGSTSARPRCSGARRSGCARCASASTCSRAGSWCC